jgi:hypothetical protein
VRRKSPSGTVRLALAVLLAGSTLLTASLLPVAPATAAEPPTRLVRVSLGPTTTLESLRQGGFDIVSLKQDAWVDLYAHPGDEARLAAMGATVQLLDDAVERHFAERAQRELAARPRPQPARVMSAVRPDGVFRTEDLPPFGSGSMGGFWTLAEVKMKLDSLVASDKRDLVADKLDTLGTTWEGRPIWGLKIGRRVDDPDPRPVAYYCAVTHAREPEGMQSLFWFVDDLLTHYDTDPFAHYLLDHRAIYICPVVNPDGYVYNQTGSPDGGGAWRKNRRNNGGGVYGVDINRNFSYQWGYDNSGSSPTPNSEIYRGPSPASEPETRAQRDMVVSLKPAVGISYHTYGDHFLHPWGYVAAMPADSAAFYEWDDAATLGTPYITGAGSLTLYTTNGDFNDWTYGDTQSKPRCFSWTPEIGTDDDGFWPLPSRIVPLAIENVGRGYFVAAIAGPYVRAESSTLAWGELVAGQAEPLAVRARNLGLAPTPANLTATLLPLDAGIAVVPGTPVTYPVLAARTGAAANGAAAFTVALDDTVTPGRLLRLEVDFTADSGYFSRDTIEVLAGHPTVALLEPCEATTNWTISSGWGVVSTDARHPDRYFADSPTGVYPNNANLRLTSRTKLDLSAGVHAWALFEARWLTEQTYDGTAVEASLDSVTWTALAGRGTSPGIMGAQPVGLPIYQAAHYTWTPDRLDLSAFAGPAGSAVRLRFRTVSDPGTNYDGFNFDSLRVLVFDPAQQPVATAVGASGATTLALAAPWPNPARSESHLGFTLPRAGDLTLAIHDLQGRRVRTLASGWREAGHYALAWDLRDEAGRPVTPGVYLARMSGGTGERTRRIVVLH